MDTDSLPAPAPTWRVVLAIASLGAGIVAGGFVGVSIVSLGGWDLDVPATIGSELGRTAMQLAAKADLADHRLPLGVAVLLNIPLWMGLVGGPLWARRRGLDWRRDLGWEMSRSDVPIGLVVGIGVQLVALPLLYIPIFWVFGDSDVDEAARSLVAGAGTPFDVLALVVLTVMAAPVIEEILFRGVLHRGLVDMTADQGRAGLVAATVASSAVFAASHFQLLQFPGLFLFGVVVAMASIRTGRLGTAVWIHVGFNATAVFGLLIDIY